MAHMYPPELQPTEGRQGEYFVYTRLRDALREPSWHVFYNLRFHTDTSCTRAREIDFVILHPDHGCLCLEVKGGEYAHDPDMGWCRVLRGQLQPDTQHGGPYSQVTSAGYALINALCAALRWNSSRLPFSWGTAVAFPFCTLRRIDGRLPADADGDITAEERVFESPQSLRAWLLRRFGKINAAFSRSQAESRTAVDAAIRGYFAPRVESVSRLASHIARAKHLEPMLTVEQRAAIKLLASQPRALVAGFAGTGKTFMAVHRAVTSFDAEPPGCKPRVLIVCYNANLAHFIQREMLPSDSAIDVANFHALCERKAEEAGCPTPSNRDQHYFDVGCVELLEEAFCTGRLAPYDTILIDEGQDFHPRWIEVLEQTLLGESGQMVVFFDPLQDVYGVGTKLPKHFGKPFTVTTNCRNTKSICGFMKASGPESLRSMESSEFAPEGASPVIVSFREAAGQLPALDKVVRLLLTEHGLEPSQIVLLSPFRRERTCLAQVDRVGGCRLVDFGRRYGTDDRAVLYYETIKSYKGLDAPCVIVHDLGAAIDLDNLASLYVGFSRGRFGLYILRRDGVKLPHEAARQ